MKKNLFNQIKLLGCSAYPNLDNQWLIKIPTDQRKLLQQSNIFFNKVSESLEMFPFLLFQAIALVFIAFNIFSLSLLFPVKQNSQEKNKVKKA